MWCVSKQRCHRYRDWFAWDDIPYVMNQKLMIIGILTTTYLVPYDYNKTNKMSISRWWWLKHVMISEPINESLRWGEGEDTEWL